MNHLSIRGHRQACGPQSVVLTHLFGKGMFHIEFPIRRKDGGSGRYFYNTGGLELMLNDKSERTLPDFFEDMVTMRLTENDLIPGLDGLQEVAVLLNSQVASEVDRLSCVGARSPKE
jgi:hypothetical protein